MQKAPLVSEKSRSMSERERERDATIGPAKPIIGISQGGAFTGALLRSNKRHVIALALLVLVSRRCEK
jgi:hypothetical protein